MDPLVAVYLLTAWAVRKLRMRKVRRVMRVWRVLSHRGNCTGRVGSYYGINLRLEVVSNYILY
jgi:hypothetical protein